MARTSVYLNFMGQTEEAFNYYKDVFGTDFSSPIMRMGDVPGDQSLPDHERAMVMHVALPILGGLVIMGTDLLESMGHQLVAGNHITLNLEPDTRAETERLYAALAAGGTINEPLQEMFWGGYFGTLVDRYGVRWMFNCDNPN